MYTKIIQYTTIIICFHKIMTNFYRKPRHCCFRPNFEITFDEPQVDLIGQKYNIFYFDALKIYFSRLHCTVVSVYKETLYKDNWENLTGPYRQKPKYNLYSIVALQIFETSQRTAQNMQIMQRDSRQQYPINANNAIDAKHQTIYEQICNFFFSRI